MGRYEIGTYYAWVKVFRIISEFRILRLTFRKKFSLKILNYDSNSFFDLFSVHLKTIYHLNLKLLIFVGILQVLRFDIKKFRIFGNFELSPMYNNISYSEVTEHCL